MSKFTTALWQFSAPQIFKLSLLSSTVTALLMSVGCTSTPTQSQVVHKTKVVGAKPSKNAGYLDAGSLDSLEDLLSATDMRAVEGDRLLILKHGDVWKRMTVNFKMDETHWDPRIDAQRNWFISRQPYLDRLSARASRYLYHTVKEAERRGMPTELALLPVIESSYDPAATSSAAAAGLWQFVPSTGRIYGLQQVGAYDARRDVVESTRAAYEFLGSLYNQFGSWELALAAYNAGPGRVQQAINRNAAAGLPTDYWSLKLPAETMNYVPRFLAVAQIVKNPRNYGVVLPPIANRPHFREVMIQPGVSLDEIASNSGLTRSELYSLNPGYRGETIDNASPGRILLPADVNPNIDKKLVALKSPNGNFWTNVPVAKNIVIKQSTTPTATSLSRPSTTIGSSTPKNASNLAIFASNADVPSAPRIPVAVTTASNVQKPISVEPPISQKEQDQIQAEIKKLDEKESVKNVLSPVANQAEQQQVVNEIKAIAPAGTEVVDPYDGKIKLTAIQTSQSIADNEGKEVTKSFSYPKPVVDTVPKNSGDAQNNKDRTYVKTDTDVVAVTPKAQRSTYRVVAGDTLAIIANKNGVSWRDIAKWNQIDANAPLFVGSSLYLYDAKPQAPTTASTTATKAKPETYVVQANDSLTGIASQFEIPLKNLADWNNLTVTSNVFVGQKLLLKEPKTAPVKNEKEEVKTQRYVVKRGEYLKLIAERYQLSSQQLAKLTDGLEADSNLFVGQKINVPVQEVEEEKPAEPDIKTESYKVKQTDTLKTIAVQSKMSLNDFAKLNHLKTTQQIHLGQTLKVPEGTQIPTTYIVQAGDSLSNIASRYNLSLDDVANLNGLNRTSGVRIGQKLKLQGELVEAPKLIDVKSVPEKDSQDYIVQTGESLHTLAVRYKTTVKELAEMNDLSVKSNLVKGKKIKVPKQSVAYKVKVGDNLIRLANKYGIEPKVLAEMNNIESTAQLRLGSTIQVPNL